MTREEGEEEREKRGEREGERERETEREGFYNKERKREINGKGGCGFFVGRAGRSISPAAGAPIALKMELTEFSLIEVKCLSPS
eukprot:scaffold293861_cov28-Tisochrysis_lutea.AAC.1